MQLRNRLSRRYFDPKMLMRFSLGICKERLIRRTFSDLESFFEVQINEMRETDQCLRSLLDSFRSLMDDFCATHDAQDAECEAVEISALNSSHGECVC